MYAMLRHVGRLCGVFSLMLLPLATASAVILEDFATGLGGWQVSGDVLEESGVAVLGDDGAYYSSLYRETVLGVEDFTFEFDFLNGLSSDTSIGFPDTFYGTLYFVNDISTFDLNTLSFDDALATLSVDYSGLFENHGTIEASALGGNWLHFSMHFSNTHNYVIPTFEFFDFNFLDGDSTFAIDNVSITEADPVPIPEPATITILAAGLAGLAFRKRREGQSAD